MNWSELLQSALTLVVAFAVRWFLGVIGVQIDDALFASLVGAIVVWLLALFGVQVARAAGVRGLK
jgi:hypothetical protein